MGRLRMLQHPLVLSFISAIIAAGSQPLVVSSWQGMKNLTSVYDSLLIFIAFVPLFLLVSVIPSFKKLCFYSWLAGTIHALITLYWVVIAMRVYGGLSIGLSVTGLVLLSLYCGLFWSGATGLSWFMLRKINISPLVSLPFTWVALEYCKNFLLTGFPWATPANALYQWPILLQTAALGGGYFIDWLVLLVNAVIAGLLLVKYFSLHDFPLKKFYIYTTIVLVGVGGYSAWQDSNPVVGPKLSIAVLQGSVNQKIKNDRVRHIPYALRRYERLMHLDGKAKAQLYIWPEAAWPLLVELDNLQQGFPLADITLADGLHLIGGVAYFQNEGRPAIHNSVFAVFPDGNIADMHHKGHLVPFSEYVPFRGLLPFDRIVPGLLDIIPGKDYVRPLRSEFGSIGSLICYEGIFPEIARGQTYRGAQILVNHTNDAWYKESSAPFQHLSFYVLRAIENRRSVVRAANNGFSAFIDPHGSIIKQSSFNSPSVLQAQMVLHEDKTIYTLFGDWFALTCILLIIATITWIIFSQEHFYFRVADSKKVIVSLLVMTLLACVGVLQISQYGNMVWLLLYCMVAADVILAVYIMPRLPIDYPSKVMITLFHVLALLLLGISELHAMNFPTAWLLVFLYCNYFVQLKQATEN